MLMTLLYHRAIKGRYGNPPEILEAHFRYLKRKYPIISPFESIRKTKLSVCITFDDATFDFYYYVFPLLKKYNLKAVLAVPIGYIEEKHEIDPLKRLLALQNFSFQNTPPSYSFCSYQELKEMVDSGLVIVASHGVDHIGLSNAETSLDRELTLSKFILEDKLNQVVDIFALPYGKYSLTTLKMAKKNYRLVMRIGNSFNFSFNKFLHFRINADQVSNISDLFNLKNNLKHAFNYFKSFFKLS